MLRKASFSRKRSKPPSTPSPPPTPPCDSNVEATSPSADASAKACKQLHGWLRKRHTSQKRLAPKWGRRYVHVDDATSMLCYAKTEGGPSHQARSCLHLSDITSIESGAQTGLPPNCFVIRCARSATGPCFDSIAFAAEDREEAKMWVVQLRLRAERAAQTPAADESSISRRDAHGRHADMLSEDDDDDDDDEGGGSRSPCDDPFLQASAIQHAAAGRHAAGAVGALHVTAAVATVPIELARVRADFGAEHECELGCTADDLLIPMTWMTSPPGWTFAMRPRGGDHGLVPTEYLELVCAQAHVLPAGTSELEEPLPAAAAAANVRVDDGAGCFDAV